MADQDPVAQWKAFTPEQRQTALGKMTSNQKNILKTKIEANGKTPSAVQPKAVPTPQDQGHGKMYGKNYGPNHPIENFAQKMEDKYENFSIGAAQKTTAAQPQILATAGGLLAGPVGAGIGGAVGEAQKEKAETGKVSPLGVAVSGTVNAALEAIPGAAGWMKKAGGRSAERVANYLGIAGKLPKFGKTFQNAKDIAQVVLDKVGIKPNLEAQKAAIETTRAAYDEATKKIVASPGGKLIDVKSTMYDRAVKLLGDLEKEGVPKEQINAIDKNLDGMIEAIPGGGRLRSTLLSPTEAHEMRREIQHQITDWNPNTVNPRQRFLQGVYHDLNDSITRSLPTEAAQAFRANNRIQSKLITARTATEATILAAGKGKGKAGLATHATRAVVGGASGAAIGAGYGALSEDDVKDKAIEGGLIGAAGLSFSGRAAPEISGKILNPRADAALSRAAAKLGGSKVVAAGSKATPSVVRAYQAIQAIQSRPQH